MRVDWFKNKLDNNTCSKHANCSQSEKTVPFSHFPLFIFIFIPITTPDSHSCSHAHCRMLVHLMIACAHVARSYLFKDRISRAAGELGSKHTSICGRYGALSRRQEIGKKSLKIGRDENSFGFRFSVSWVCGVHLWCCFGFFKISSAPIRKPQFESLGSRQLNGQNRFIRNNKQVSVCVALWVNWCKQK